MNLLKNKNFKTIALFGAIVILFYGCINERKVAKYLKDHPELIKSDTIFRVDTIVILGHSVDTVFHYKQTDTVIVKENGVTVKYFYNIRDSTVYLKGERDTVMIVQKVPLEVNNVIKLNDETKMHKFWRQTKDYLLVALLGVIIVLTILMKKKIL